MDEISRTNAEQKLAALKIKYPQGESDPKVIRMLLSQISAESAKPVSKQEPAAPLVN